MATERTGFAAEGAKAAYDQLKNDRQPYETRAENCAKLTVPSLFPKDSDNNSTNYTTPWQSVGARGLNNIVAKLMLSLFPMNSWMKLTISEFEAKQLTANPEQLAKVDEGLAMVERIMMNFMDSNSYRVTLFEAMRQLVVSGNALLYIPTPDKQFNPMKLYRLSAYTVQRDAYGNILQIITLDKVAFSALPEDVKGKLDGDHEADEEMEIYTHIYLDEETGSYLKYEEIDGEELEGTDGSYPVEALPYLPVRMVRLDGESYGRSYVEEYLGDLQSLENLQESIVKQAMIASKVVGLVNPNGLTQVRRLNKAQTGDWVAGRKEDVSFLQLEKTADFTVAKAVADAIETRLSYAFMLNSAVQRNAERVTAAEIRYVAAELEATLGGVYSILSQELQLPIVRVLLNQLQATSQIPQLPKEAVEPTVVTGMDALGRGQDLDKLTQLVELWTGLAGVAQMPGVNIQGLMLAGANALGMDTAGIMQSQEERMAQMGEDAMQTGSQAAAQAGGAAAGQAMGQDPEAMAQAAQQAGMA